MGAVAGVALSVGTEDFWCDVGLGFLCDVGLDFWWAWTFGGLGLLV